jgi:aminoglycoside phosphotransferase
MTTEIEGLLPATLCPPGTRVQPVGVGQSGAGVFRLDGPAGAFVVKQTSATEPAAVWERGVAVQRAAARVGVAPAVVHVDATHRLVVSEAITDQGWAQYFAQPATHAPAMHLLGTTIRRLHALPIAAELPLARAASFVRQIQQAANTTHPLPGWVNETIDTLLGEEPPVSDRAPVVSHNDLNPSNLVFDGTRLLLLDWQTAAVNDPYYDLALVSVFSRMDASACLRLLTAYAGHSVTTLPARFVWSRRLASVVSGTALLWVAGLRGYRGAAPATVGDGPTLLDVYTSMRAGALTMHDGEGQWRLGLAVFRETA